MAGLSILVAGLGNRQVTPDSLGPRAWWMGFRARHAICGRSQEAERMAHTSIRLRKRGGRCIRFSAVSIQGDGTDRDGDGRNCPRRRAGNLADLVIAVDALAARNVHRLCSTDVTDTGIHPGFRRRQPPPGNDAGKSRCAGNRDRRSDGCGRSGDRSRDGQCVSADTNRLKRGRTVNTSGNWIRTASMS